MDYNKASDIYDDIVELLRDIKAKGFNPNDIEEIMELVRDYAEARIKLTNAFGS